MKLAVISDTHDLLRPQVLEQLKGADAIVHGGDISSMGILQQLEQLGRVYAVRGNNDKEWAEFLPRELRFTVDGLRFFMVHKKGEIPKDLTDTDVVVYGHSHKYAMEEKNGVLYLNPGSCGPRRFGQEITMALLDTRTRQVEKILIPHPENNKK